MQRCQGLDVAHYDSQTHDRGLLFSFTVSVSLWIDLFGVSPLRIKTGEEFRLHYTNNHKEMAKAVF